MLFDSPYSDFPIVSEKILAAKTGALTKCPRLKRPSNVSTPSARPPNTMSKCSLHLLWHLISRWMDCLSTPEHCVLNIFWGRNVTAEHSVQTFLANPTVWHFVSWLHFIHTYLTSIFPIKIATFLPKGTFRHLVTLHTSWLVTLHPDCFWSIFFPFCDILSLCYTCLTLWHLVHTFGVTVGQNRNLPTHGSVCRVP